MIFKTETKKKLICVCIMVIAMFMCGGIMLIGDSTQVSESMVSIEVENTTPMTVRPDVGLTATLPVVSRFSFSTIDRYSPKTREPVEPEPSVEDIYTDEITYLAKTVWGEARGCEATDQAAVVWCVLNRVDAGYGSIIDVVTAPNQFHGYNSGFEITDDIRELVIDVLGRWEREKSGETDVGRILPADYLFFYGDGVRNHFRNAYKGGNTWDWSLASPYDI